MPALGVKLQQKDRAVRLGVGRVMGQFLWSMGLERDQKMEVPETF